MAERWRRSGREYILLDLIKDLILDLRYGCHTGRSAEGMDRVDQKQKHVDKGF